MQITAVGLSFLVCDARFWSMIVLDFILFFFVGKKPPLLSKRFFLISKASFYSRVLLDFIAFFSLREGKPRLFRDALVFPPAPSFSSVRDQGTPLDPARILESD